MNTSEVLNWAADLIEERGWTSGAGWEHEKGGPLCIEGGILAATGGSFLRGDRNRCPAYQAVREYLLDAGVSPFIWNDHLAHGRIHAAIKRGETLGVDLSEVRAEAEDWAKSRVIEVLRACAVIEAARERQAVTA